MENIECIEPNPYGKLMPFSALESTLNNSMAYVEVFTLLLVLS